LRAPLDEGRRLPGRRRGSRRSLPAFANCRRVWRRPSPVANVGSREWRGRIGRRRHAGRTDPVRRGGARDARGDHVSYFRQPVRGVSTARERDEASAARTEPLAARPGGQAPSSGLDALAGAGAVRVRVIVLRVHDPPLRAAPAHDAPKEHRTPVARHAVVMTGHVAADPTPHKSPSLRSDDARAKGNFDARCTNVLPIGKDVQICAWRLERRARTAWSKPRS
jgi:hypothetical protein